MAKVQRSCWIEAQDGQVVLHLGGAWQLGDLRTLAQQLQGPGGPVRYPVPWSSDGTTSFLLDREALERHLGEAGFEVVEHRDRREESVAWFEARLATTAAAGGPPPMSVQILLGPVFKEAFANLVANMREQRAAPTIVRAVRR